MRSQAEPGEQLVQAEFVKSGVKTNDFATAKTTANVGLSFCWEAGVPGFN